MELTLKAKGRGTLTAGEHGETPYQTGSFCRGNENSAAAEKYFNAR